MVEVEENSETLSFMGRVDDVYENEVDGIVVSVVDQEDNCYDIDLEYISVCEE